MSKKTVLISIDGMRPDGLLACNNPYTEKLLKDSSYTLKGRACFPSVTLPCHLSMFLSVPPERHLTMSNTYIPPVRPVTGLFEALHAAGKKCAMFYGWEELRDISRPGNIDYSLYIESYTEPSSDTVLTDAALEHIKEKSPDFVFLYLVETDTKGGHDEGWMSEEYLNRISIAVDCVKKVIDSVGEEYSVVVTADHGGHARGHGDDSDEDMTIPMIFHGKEFEKNKEIYGASLLSIAPTIAQIMDVPAPREWEGKSVLDN